MKKITSHISIHPEACKLKSEFPKWKILLWKVCGVKREVEFNGYFIKAYYFLGFYLIDKFEDQNEN